ncbi:AbrB/MazE/SpoVT family DNA-binding domain-containing protein [Pectobacterium brasiliense]|uniref:AbrB/MazE/SpoVT family DNA-binding domain-containing protein n=1 Tax=Pectobacterium brasiliense TaxID=180957 RepID=UPI0015DDB3D3|nr:AbrB/MazE/SpoVT family DNA-binding domain-containing protein [Pectobacterium brasiliense]MBA0216584.1 AbrB/MazE/SpoVT family DNA-binding domain-containing protein [Pectobacterium brasiliense]
MSIVAEKTTGKSARLRKQGRAIVVTIPKEIALAMNWKEGEDVIFVQDNDALKIMPQTVKPRKRRMSPDELVSDLSAEDIQTLREATQPFQQLKPTGREIF